MTLVWGNAGHSQASWERFQPDGRASLLQWLPGWCDDVTRSAEDESSWCVSHLPELHPQLVLQLLAAAFAKVEGSFRTRLGSALAKGTLCPLRFGLLLVKREGGRELS